MSINAFVKNKNCLLENTRSNNFNIIRFVAAFMVIYGHMSSIMGLPAQTILAQRVSTIGVKSIFVISGYLITKSCMSDDHYGRFLFRRCIRIFPPLILMVLVVVFIMGPVFTVLPFREYFHNYGTRYYFRNILLYPIYSLPGVFADCPYPNVVNGSLWTLPVEFALYLVLPIIITLFKKFGALKQGIAVTAILSLGGSIARVVFFPDVRLVFYGTNWPDALSLLPYYFMGALFSLFDMKKYLNIQIGILLISIASFCTTNQALNELAVGLALPYFILSVGLIQEPLFSSFFEKADFSYGIYLYGFPVQQVLYQIIHPFFPSCGVLTMSVVSFGISLCFAVLSWFLLERHIQKLSKVVLLRWTKKK